MPRGAVTQLTSADEAAIIAAKAEGMPESHIKDRWEIGKKRLDQIVVQPRHTAGSLLNAGSEAQLNNGYEFSTSATAKPPTIRKAALTSRKRWIEVSDFCDKCAGIFSIHAPRHVAGRAHVLWVQRHKCEKVDG